MPTTRRAPRGLTLVELMITMAIFLVIAGFAVAAVVEVVKGWSASERRRLIYERASGALDTLSSDLRLTVTQEPPGVTQVRARLIGDIDPQTRQQRLLFVRAFEAGPERAMVFGAGDGKPNILQYSAGSDGSVSVVSAVDAQGQGIDSDTFTGQRVGDFKPLGGLAAVGYFLQNETLYRSIQAPPPDSLAGLASPSGAQVLATDALYLGFEYWSQDTNSWDGAFDKQANVFRGPQPVWDSTRAIEAGVLKKFFLHRGKDSALDTDDDVFPAKVRVTLVLDSPMPRCVHTKLEQELNENELGWVEVGSTRGFGDGEDLESYIYVAGEWMRFKRREENRFDVVERGARGTKSVSHQPGALVRTGRPFRKVIYLNGWREDTEPDDVWRARREAQREEARTINAR